MNDMLPKNVKKYERGIVNLGSLDTSETHWICDYRNNRIKCYFDSYGGLIHKPDKEAVKYLRKKYF